jgi:hypothetical protein
MISLDQVIAMALKHESVMAQLGSALRDDLVCPDPFKRRIVEFAADFPLNYGRLPSSGDYQVWFEALETGMILDGTREALGRLYTINVSDYHPEHFVDVALPILKKAAARVAQARINEAGGTPEVITMMAERIQAINVSAPGDRRLRLFPTLADLHKPNAWSAEVEAEAEELIPRLAWRGRHVMLAGREKLGKSTFAAAGAVAMTTGGPFLDGTAAHGRVLWLAMDESLGDAFPRLIDNGAMRTHLAVENPPDPAAFLRTWLPASGQCPDLIVVDSLIEYTRRTTREMPASGDSAAWAAVVRPLTKLAQDYDVGILTIHHASKATGDFRDSTEIGAAVDAMLTMFPSNTEQEETVRRIRLVGRRSIVTRETSYSVRLEQDPVTVPVAPGEFKTVQRDRYVLGAGGGAPPRPGGVDAEMAKRIEEFVTATPGCKQPEIFKAAGGSQTIASKTLQKLVEWGRVDEHKDGKRLLYYPPTKVESNDAGGEHAD